MAHYMRSDFHELCSFLLREWQHITAGDAHTMQNKPLTSRILPLLQLPDMTSAL